MTKNDTPNTELINHKSAIKGLANIAICTILLTVLNYPLSAQNIDKKSTTENCDSLIKKNFFKLARSIKQLMDKHANMSTQEDINMIKIYNTISISGVGGDSLNKNRFLENFKVEFNMSYYSILKKKYALKITKGGTQYLSKVDLYLGMGPIYRCKDSYSVY